MLFVKVKIIIYIYKEIDTWHMIIIKEEHENIFLDSNYQFIK
jgi:hypothetical protein